MIEQKKLTVEQEQLKWLRLVEEHRIGNRFNHEQPFTPVSLIKEITDKIAITDCSKIGVMFTVEWAIYLERNGFCDLTLITDKYDRVASTWASILGCDYETFESIEEKQMKFDVVVGNPPYLKRGWKKFVEKMSELSVNHVMTINPDPTSNKSSFGDQVREVFTKAGVYKIEDCTKHFPNVDSGLISYFLCAKENKQQYNFNKGKPIDIITDKVCARNPAFVMRGSQKSLTVEFSEDMTSVFSVPGIFSLTNDGMIIKHIKEEDSEISKKHKDKLSGAFFVINRFFGKNNPDPVVYLPEIAGHFIGYNVMVLKADKDDTLEGFQSVYGSKLYRAVIANIRGGGFDITQSGLSSLEKLDLSKVWTAEELYSHFDLSPEEIKNINEIA